MHSTNMLKHTLLKLWLWKSKEKKKEKKERDAAFPPFQPHHHPAGNLVTLRQEAIPLKWVKKWLHFLQASRFWRGGPLAS